MGRREIGKAAAYSGLFFGGVVWVICVGIIMGVLFSLINVIVLFIMACIYDVYEVSLRIVGALAWFVVLLVVVATIYIVTTNPSHVDLITLDSINRERLPGVLCCLATSEGYMCMIERTFFRALERNNFTGLTFFSEI